MFFTVYVVFNSEDASVCWIRVFSFHSTKQVWILKTSVETHDSTENKRDPRVCLVLVHETTARGAPGVFSIGNADEVVVFYESDRVRK